MKASVLILTSLILFVSTAVAERKSWGEIVDRYLDVDVELAAAKSTLDAAESSLKLAYTSALPSVEFVQSVADQKVAAARGGAVINFPSTIHEANIQFSQPIFLGGQVWTAVNIAENSRDAQKMSYLASRRLSVQRILNLTLEYLAEIERLKVIRDSEKVQEEFLRLTGQRKKRGNARSYELEQARSELYAYGPRRLASEQAVDTWLHQLRQQLDWGEFTGVTQPRLSFPAFQRPQDLDQYAASVLAQRPDLVQARMTVDATKLNRTLEHQSFYPSVDLTGQIGYLGSEFGSLYESQNEQRTVSLNLTIPLNTFSHVYTRQEQKDEVLAAERNYRVRVRQLKIDVYQAGRRLETAQLSLVQSQRWASSAKKALKAGQSDYRSGVIDNLQVVQLQVASERAQLGEIDARLLLQQNWLNWLYLTNGDLKQFYQ